MDYGRYRRLRFDRPHPRVLCIIMDNGKMNTADATMHGELVQIWRDIDTDPSVNCAIITGAGTVFSAGGDFELVEELADNFEVRVRVWREASDLVYNMVSCRKPVVSAMRGVAVGAGLVCGIWRMSRSPRRIAGSRTGIQGWGSPPGITRRSFGRCCAAWPRPNTTC